MIFIILLVGLLLRLLNLNQSLWLDEAINVNAAKGLDFVTLTTKYSLGDFHPPMYHLILKTGILLFGFSEIVVRMPSVLFGLVTIYMTYQIGKKLFETKTALVAATLIATSPLHIYYSQEARMYMLAAMLTSISVYFFISLIEEDKLKNWFGFIASTVLLLYSDYLPYFMIIAYLLFTIVFRKKIKVSTIKSFLPAFILISFLLIPWVLVFPRQFSTGLSAASASPAWSHIVGSSNGRSLIITFVKIIIGRISNSNDLIYALLFLPIASVTFLTATLSTFRLSVYRSIIWFWFLIPIFLAFIVSFFVPIFAYFRFIFVLPAFYLIIASGIITLNWAKLNRILLTSFLAINLVCVSIYFLNPKFQREDWKSAAAYVTSRKTDNTVVLFESNFPMAPFEYYNYKNIPAFGALDSFNPQEDKVDMIVKNTTQNKDRVYLFQYLSQITDPDGLAFKELTNDGFKNTQTRDFTGVGFLYEFRH